MKQSALSTSSNPKLYKRTQVRSALVQLFALVLGLVLLLPLIYAVKLSFLGPAAIIGSSTSGGGFWKEASWENYAKILGGNFFFRYLFNSFFVAFLTSLLRVFTASLAAYAFAYFEFRLKKFLFFMVLGTMIVPAEMLMIPNYFTTSELGLINTYLGMTLVYAVSAANIFLLRQSFMTQSMSIREAAKIDGCNNFYFLLRILLPISKPILATVFISSFVTSWNAYLWPLLVTNRDEMRTAQVIITKLGTSELQSSYGEIMAAAVLILLPSVVIFGLFQRQITSGMAAGAVKE